MDLDIQAWHTTDLRKWLVKDPATQARDSLPRGQKGGMEWTRLGIMGFIIRSTSLMIDRSRDNARVASVALKLLNTHL